MIIKNGLVFLAEENGFVKRDIRVENEVIAEVAPSIAGTADIDAGGMFVTPGLVEAHSHIGAYEESIGWEGDDICENTPVTPEMRGIDAINPFDVAFAEALTGGVTTICTGPGSAGVVAGTFVLLENNGGRVIDQMTLRPDAAMKCAFGENPRDFGRHDKQPNTRMGVAALLRGALEDAIHYRAEQEQAEKEGKPFQRKLGMEQMVRVLRRELPLKCHVHRADDICTAIRIAQEYNLRMTLDHCTEGHLIADYIAGFDYPCIVGPSFGSKSKYELKNKTFDTVPALCKAGVKVSITTDHNVNPQESLILFAAMAVKAGLDEGEALRCVTSNPAEILDIADRKGRIATGLDADLVLWTKHPLDVQADARSVYIRGRQVH